MSKQIGGIVVLVVIFLIGAWAGAKWPSANLIGKYT
jgi:hypothetical protein